MTKEKLISTLPLIAVALSISLTACQNRALHSASFLEQLNGFRAQSGRCGTSQYPAAKEVRYSDSLAEAAQTHAEEMKSNGYFDHTDLAGGSVGNRVTSTGYRWVRVAENLSRGPKDNLGALDSWEKSEGHCINLRDTQVEEVGLGQAGEYWVLVLATGSQ